jgi:hypothetical protein
MSLFTRSGRGESGCRMGGTWPEAKRLGTLNLTLKDGKIVTLRYYQAPLGELRFSVDNAHYRLAPVSGITSSDSLDADVRLVISIK